MLSNFGERQLSFSGGLSNELLIEMIGEQEKDVDAGEVRILALAQCAFEFDAVWAYFPAGKREFGSSSAYRPKIN